MNDIATRSATSSQLAALNTLKAGLANVRSTLVKRGGEPFLRMLRDGSWVYGAENVDVEPGSLWAINPLSIMHGWVAWKRGEGADNSGGPLGEVMGPLGAPLPPSHTLRDVGADWEQQFSFSLICMTGSDKGEQVLYKSASAGGVNAVDDILKAIQNQIAADQMHPVPVVLLDSGTYVHRKWGKTYFPVIKIHQWIELTDDLPDVHADLAAEQAAEAPETPATPAAAEKPVRQRKAAEKAPAAAEKPLQAADLDEDPEIAAMMAEIAAKQAAKAAAKQATVAVDPAAAAKAARLAQLRAEAAALEAEDGEPAPQAAAQAVASEAGQPLRRRRVS